MLCQKSAAWLVAEGVAGRTSGGTRGAEPGRWAWANAARGNCHRSTRRLPSPHAEIAIAARGVCSHLCARNRLFLPPTQTFRSALLHLLQKNRNFAAEKHTQPCHSDYQTDCLPSNSCARKTSSCWAMSAPMRRTSGHCASPFSTSCH